MLVQDIDILVFPKACVNFYPQRFYPWGLQRSNIVKCYLLLLQFSSEVIQLASIVSELLRGRAGMGRCIESSCSCQCQGLVFSG